MDKLIMQGFDIKPDKNKILRAAGCLYENTVYQTASRYFDELFPEIYGAFEPYAAAKEENGRIYCLVTIGAKVPALISGLFDTGSAVKGLIADAMADEYLFEADRLLSLEIKRRCAEDGMGVKKRISAPEDFPLAEQSVILEKIGSDAVSLTEAMMLNPVKIMAYILELTDNADIFNAQHDCSVCAAKDCPRRSAVYRGEYEILSDYAYTPLFKRELSAVCVDIGTTTLAFEYISSGGVKALYKTVNPQRRFGYDVLSRIEAANRGRLSELTNDIRLALKKGFEAVTDGKKAPEQVVIAGNTTMIHLLLGVSCASLGTYPFKSDCLEPMRTTLDRLVTGCGDIPINIFGGISAFVGGDIVSGMYMCGFHETEKINLFVDLGTNGEMAVGNKNKILATSAAAGPAFEGGMISCGMGSVDGAVCSVTLNPASIKTIGGKTPAGICGTGIIELLSEMKDNNIIDENGLLCEQYFDKGFPVTDKIIFSQADIRQVQTAKAAVRAGIECLMREYGINSGSIDTVYLAGGFGGGLDAKKACNIGILPHELMSKVKIVGNSSLGGCVKLCTEENSMDAAGRIRAVSADFPLAENKDFNELYIKYMNF